ncbi:hypothetical protein MVES_000461 [Malassezia vespertilionis]|uniref:pyridoxal 5'-phosphate synthase n=1 Tax=Malassezia vespertilionis TaxID=2020962 RepID=A0A2N1JG97_9BASI|nr:hypothetical protein MVES_000461 [Malassezia vespertilionis]
MNISGRTQYQSSGFTFDDLTPTPMTLFSKWYAEAVDAGVLEPEAMTLCTTALPNALPPALTNTQVDKSGWRVDAPRPSARMVLLKHAGNDGFQFFTNYLSRKGNELEANPWCSLTFYWPQVFRSVRVLGRVERLSEQASQSYYDARPLGSKIGAWASPQSEPIVSREELTERVKNTEAKFGVQSTDDASKHIPLPPFWGGYRVVPDEVEFWAGRMNRLHDRFRYVRDPNTQSPLDDASTWTIEALGP